MRLHDHGRFENAGPSLGRCSSHARASGNGLLVMEATAGGLGRGEGFRRRALLRPLAISGARNASSAGSRRSPGLCGLALRPRRRSAPRAPSLRAVPRGQRRLRARFARPASSRFSSAMVMHVEQHCARSSRRCRGRSTTIARLSRPMAMLSRSPSSRASVKTSHVERLGCIECRPPVDVVVPARSIAAAISRLLPSSRAKRQRLFQMLARGGQSPCPSAAMPSGWSTARPRCVSDLARDRQAFLQIVLCFGVPAHEQRELARVHEAAASREVACLRARRASASAVTLWPSPSSPRLSQ